MLYERKHRHRSRLATLTAALLLFIGLAVIRPAELQLVRTAEAATATFYTTGDAMVHSGFPTNNFGGDLLYSSRGPARMSFVAFNVSSIPSCATVVDAQLLLTVADISGTLAPATPELFEIHTADAPWSEATVTWGSMPPTTPIGTPAVLIGNGGTYSWDVAPAVQSWITAGSNHGFSVMAVNSGSYGILPWSKEFAPTSAELPQLVVDYHEDDCPGQGDSGSDLGDAPDSSNHHGVANTAYLAGPIFGRFPTVWDSPISGPKHHNTRPAFLGDGVTGEEEADIGPDVDGPNNILTGGADRIDEDGKDDGWLNPDAPFFDCQATELVVRVSRDATLPTPDLMYLNVWFDGERDGDWDGIKECQGPAGFTDNAFEWIVQDFAVNMGAIPTGGSVDINVGTVRVMNPTGNKMHWMRFTLSESKAPTMPGSPLADGRGPQQPALFELGETEDYMQLPQDPQGEPGELTIDKAASQAVGGSHLFTPGDIFTYSIWVEHHGGSAPAATTMTDMLPAGVVQAGPVSVHEEVPSVGPLSVSISGSTITWNGGLSPNGRVRIDIPVRVLKCFQFGTRTIINEAKAIQTDGSVISAATSIEVNCLPIIVLDDIYVVASLSDLRPAPPRGAEGEALPFGQKALEVGLRNDNEETATFIILADVDDQARLIDSNYPPTGEGMDEWEFTLAPDETATLTAIYERVEGTPDDTEIAFDVMACLRGDDGTGCPAVDDALPGQIKVLPQLIWLFKARDLGDAPDSSNHFGLGMTTYGSTVANFPTVRDASTGLPVGPAHVRARAFHLGEGVSREREADFGADSDGINNIVPPTNVADRDRFDDGANPNSWSLNHCASSEIDVQVYIHPNALVYMGNQQTDGHLNIWTDSNRDGDWDDLYDCPGFNHAISEHVVVNHPVNVMALGPGLHTITLPTGAVPWFGDSAEGTWFRVMLTTKKISLPLTGGGISYSDGRGEASVFIMGETEDYLRAPQDDSADVYIKKSGQNDTEYDDQGNPTTHTFWQINYGNLGPAAATNVQITDMLSGGQTLVNVITSPIVPWTILGNTLTFNVGTLPAGASGSILIETKLVGTPQTDELMNAVDITADNDSDSSNNADTASVPFMLHPPIITNPLNGTTCSNVVVIDGVSIPGTTVDVYVNSALLGNYPTDAAGNWGVTTTLPDGAHTVHAVAKSGGSSSAASATTLFVVNSTLPYSPMSLRFTDAAGNTSLAPDSSGRFDGVDPQITLQPNMTYTVSLELCCEDDNNTVEIDIPGVGTVPMTDPDGDNVYEGSFMTGDPGTLTSTSVLLTIICDGSEIIVVGGVTLIDPAGEVYDITDGSLQADATVTLDEKLSGVYSFWPAAAFGQLNPQTTAADGWFSFFTPAGTYRLSVEKTGYQDYVSTDIEVVDQLVIYNVPLTPEIGDDADVTVYVNEDGFSDAALEVSAGDVVEFVSVSAETMRSHSDTLLTRGSSGGFDSGMLAPGSSYKVAFNDTGTVQFEDDNGNIGFVTVSPSTPTAVSVAAHDSGHASSVLLLITLLATLSSTTLIIRKRSS